jgi:hypothetical protein
VAAAISLFGFDSGAALATVVGVPDRGAGDGCCSDAVVRWPTRRRGREW